MHSTAIIDELLVRFLFREWRSIVMCILSNTTVAMASPLAGILSVMLVLMHTNTGDRPSRSAIAYSIHLIEMRFIIMLLLSQHENMRTHQQQQKTTTSVGHKKPVSRCIISGASPCRSRGGGGAGLHNGVGINSIIDCSSILCTFYLRAYVENDFKCVALRTRVVCAHLKSNMKTTRAHNEYACPA